MHFRKTAAVTKTPVAQQRIPEHNIMLQEASLARVRYPETCSKNFDMRSQAK